MMYREQYVAVVMQNGKIQPEDQNGVVVLPFESEYILRLKNKLRKKAVADVHIDGRLAVRGVIIEPLGSIDLERFVEGFMLSGGPRFRLVKMSDSRVVQPGDSENGIVTVNFYPEKDQPKVVEEHRIIHDHCYRHHHHPYRCPHGNCPSCCYWCGSHIHLCSSGGDLSFKGGEYINTCDSIQASYGSAMGGGGTTSMAMNAGNITPTANLNLSANVQSEPAATVEGSHSAQQFHTAYVDVDRDHPVTIQLKLKGVVQLIQSCPCGFKRTDEAYCPKCGNKLQLAA